MFGGNVYIYNTLYAENNNNYNNSAGAEYGNFSDFCTFL